MTNFLMQGSNHRSRNPVSRLLDRAFPPRELFLRSGDDVRYYRLSSTLQKGSAAAAMCLAGLAVVLVIVTLSKAQKATMSQRALQLVAEERTEAQDEAVLYRRDLDRLAERLEAQYSFLAGIVPSSPDAMGASTKGNGDAPGLAAADDSIGHPRLSESLTGIDQALSQVAGHNLALSAELESVQELLATAQADRKDFLAEKQHLTGVLSELQSDQKALRQAKKTLEIELANLQSAVTAKRTLSQEKQPPAPNLLAEGRWRAARDQAVVLQREVDHLTEQWGKARRANLDLARQRDAIKRELQVMKIALAMASQGGPAPNREVADLHARLEEALDDKSAIIADRDGLIASLEATKRELGTADLERVSLRVELNTLRAQLSLSEDARSQLLTDKAGLAEELASLKQQSQHQDVASLAVSGVTGPNSSALDAALQRESILKKDNDLLHFRIASLEERLEAMESSRQEVLTRISEHAVANIELFERTIEKTGVGIDDLLLGIDASEEEMPQGGPFFPIDREGEFSTTSGVSLGFLEMQMRRLNGLQAAFQSLPLGAPLKEYRVTSRFGRRKDPINKRRAMHFGLDFASALRAPILATAPGKVTMAGHNGRYGRMVVIDHGFGLKTRYAHLRKIFVKLGQTVTYHQELGQLGSSGRVTGPHLHYEVLFNGKPHDPLKFIEAGKDVFEG